jgi:hypothetical protein
VIETRLVSKFVEMDNTVLLYESLIIYMASRKSMKV